GPQINGVDVRAEYTLVRLPAQLPAAVIERLSKVRIRGQTLDLREGSESEAAGQTQGASQGSKAPRLDQLSLCSCGTTHACATQGTCRLLISVGFRRVAILRSRISPEQRMSSRKGVLIAVPVAAIVAGAAWFLATRSAADVPPAPAPATVDATAVHQRALVLDAHVDILLPDTSARYRHQMAARTPHWKNSRPAASMRWCWHLPWARDRAMRRASRSRAPRSMPSLPTCRSSSGAATAPRYWRWTPMTSAPRAATERWRSLPRSRTPARWAGAGR